jgi:hypothetical protein
MGNWLLQTWRKETDIDRSDLNKNIIIEPTFDYLSEEDHKALEAYLKVVDELFFSHYEVTR